MVVVDTVTLLKLIHDGFAISRENSDDEVFAAAQSLLSILVYHLRHPLAELDGSHGETIRLLETAVRRARRQRRTRRPSTGTDG
jgi:hypothetical protein